MSHQPIGVGDATAAVSTDTASADTAFAQGGRGVVIVNYGSSSMIATGVDAEMFASVNARVALVDNFSTDAERVAAHDLAAERGWLFVGRDNDGYGGGVNAGCTALIEAGCRSLLLLNPDAEATAPALDALFEHLEADSSCLVSPTIRTSAGGYFFRGSTLNTATGHLRGGWVEQYDSWPPADGVVNWLSGCCLGFSDAVFTRLDGMAEDLFLYWEDVDFSWRAQDAGFSLAVLPDEIVHDEGGTHNDGSAASSQAKSNTYYYWNTRNRLAFAAAHLDRSTVARWARSTPGESAAIWLRGGRRQLIERPSGLVAATRGSVAGMKIAGRRLLNRTPKTAPSSADAGARRVLVAHPGPDLYGSDRTLLESVSAFIESGAEVTVALPHTGPLVHLLEERGATVVMCPSPVIRKSYLSPTGVLRLGKAFAASAKPARDLIARVDPDFVFINTITIPGWIPLARSARRRVVVHVHEAERHQPMAIKRVLYAPLLLADELIINSNYALDVMADVWPQLRSRATVVYNGVVGPDEVTALPETIEHPRLLFLGRLSPRKGPHIAIEALHQLRSGGVDAHLSLLGAIFPGYEWFEEQLQEQVQRAHLEDDVTFLGFHANIWRYLAAADIVIVASTADEPFGNAAVEAVLAGRPLVVSKTSGLREAAAGYDAVRMVPASDAGALADAIRDVMANWATVRDQVVVDRQRALARHLPEVYRHTLALTLGLPHPDAAGDSGVDPHTDSPA